jgi:hypothetical protein
VGVDQLLGALRVRRLVGRRLASHPDENAEEEQHVLNLCRGVRPVCTAAARLLSRRCGGWLLQRSGAAPDLTMATIKTRSAICSVESRWSSAQADTSRKGQVSFQSSPRWVAFRCAGGPGAPRNHRQRQERERYRVGPKVSSWPNILTVTPY